MQDLEKAKIKALLLMSSSGFPLQDDVPVVMDKKLQFMGYTLEKNDKPMIVVSSMAVSTGQVMGLLIHEMSHIYRGQEKHPSHNYPLLTKIFEWTFGDIEMLSYQEKIIHGIINHVQDLYADDLSFQVFAKNPNETFPKENIADFFLGWIHNPVKGSSTKSIWTNADYLLSCAFAQANLERHNVADNSPAGEKKVERTVIRFLAQLDKRLIRKYSYFKNFMVDLPEKISDADYGKMMVVYLNEFLKLTNNLHSKS